MNRDELVSQIRFLLKLQEDKDAIIDRQQESLDEMKADLKEARKDNKALQKQLAESSKKLLSELLTGNNKTRTLFAHSVGFENASLLPQTIGIKR